MKMDVRGYQEDGGFFNFGNDLMDALDDSPKFGGDSYQKNKFDQIL